MRKTIFNALLSILFIAACATASSAQNAGDYNKVEFYGGFSHARVEPNSGTQTVSEGGQSFSFEPCTPDGAAILGSNFQRNICDRRGFNGFDSSVAYNLSRYFGVKANVTGHFKTETFVDHFSDSGGHTDTNRVADRTWQFLGGLQVKDNGAEKRVKPFAHALFGVARQTSHDVQTSTGGTNFTLDDTATSFAMKLGGGLDVRLSRRVDLRVIEFDYNPIFARDRDVSGNAEFTLHVAGRRSDTFTFGVGIAFH
jgi:opacity protein-like surface antigen